MVSDDLINELLAKQFWHNLAKDRELQVRSEDTAVVVSYGAEDLLAIDYEHGALSCRVRPRLIPIHPELFYRRRYDAWLSMRVTSDGALRFEVSPEVVELGVASPETVLAYKEVVQRSGNWEWRRLLVQFASQFQAQLLASKVPTPWGTKLGDYAVYDPNASVIQLVKVVDAVQLSPSSEWLQELVLKCGRTIEAFNAEIAQHVRDSAQLRERLGVICHPDPGISSASVDRRILLAIGNCTTETLRSIRERDTGWEWLSEDRYKAACTVLPTGRFSSTQAD